MGTIGRRNKKLSLKDLDCSEVNEVAICYAKTSPEDKSEDNIYLLEFGVSKGLYNIGKMNINKNSDQGNIKKTFEKINNQIKMEYGKPIKINNGTDEEEYFICLADDNCKEIKTIYEKSDIKVTIHLNGNTVAIGYFKSFK